MSLSNYVCESQTECVFQQAIRTVILIVISLLPFLSLFFLCNAKVDFLDESLHHSKKSSISPSDFCALLIYSYS